MESTVDIADEYVVRREMSEDMMKLRNRYRGGNINPQEKIRIEGQQHCVGKDFPT
jgi:hypothetical protein